MEHICEKTYDPIDEQFYDEESETLDNAKGRNFIEWFDAYN